MADDDSNELGPVYGRGQPGGHPLYRNKKGQVEETKPPPSDPQVSDTGDIYGKQYKFTAVTDPENWVEGYTAQGPTGDLPDQAAIQKALGQAAYKGKSADVPQGSEFDIGGEVGDPAKLTDKEYDQLTQEAARGNKLAREILVRGHYKAQDFPSLQQDLNKMEDPFVKALGNMGNVANAAESQIVAATQPYDFSNAETQVNNILANQGYARNAQPSAQTSAYVNKLDQIASGNPLTASALGLPSIDQALGGLGPAAKLSEKAAPNAALLAALLSHIQYQDVYGTGLSGATGNNPAWLQQLLAAVTGTGAGGALPSPVVAATPSATGSSTSGGVIPNTG